MNRPLYTWADLPVQFIVVTTDKFGMQAAHSEYPVWVPAANKWVSTGRKDLGLVGTHHEDNPLALYDFRPGHDKPYWFPRVLKPDYDALNQQALPQVHHPNPVPAVVSALDTRGTIAAPRMEALMAKRNDNTDPKIPITKVEPAIVDVEKAAKSEDRRSSLRVPDPSGAMPSSAETVYTALVHALRALDEMRTEDPNWAKVDHHVNALQDILDDVKWPIVEYKG